MTGTARALLDEEGVRRYPNLSGLAEKQLWIAELVVFVFSCLRGERGQTNTVGGKNQ